MVYDASIRDTGASMTLASMTGFSRAAGGRGAWRWAVEIKCVNAKGLDLRLKLPSAARPDRNGRAGAARQSARARDLLRHLSPRSARARQSTAKIDVALLAELAAAASAAALQFGLAPPTLDGLLAAARRGRGRRGARMTRRRSPILRCGRARHARRGDCGRRRGSSGRRGRGARPRMLAERLDANRAL